MGHIKPFVVIISFPKSIAEFTREKNQDRATIKLLKSSDVLIFALPNLSDTFLYPRGFCRPYQISYFHPLLSEVSIK
jgi:hypothetical protein